MLLAYFACVLETLPFQGEMSVHVSPPASRPYYAITSSPLGHLLRKRSSGFRDTLLWERRPLRLPLRIYTDGGSSSAVGELARSVAGRNVSFINLEEVQPWAPAVFCARLGQRFTTATSVHTRNA